MASNSSVVDCFFCGTAPCSCNKKAEKPKQAKAKQPVPVAAKKPARKIVAPSIKAAAPPVVQPVEHKQRFKAEPEQPPKDQGDLEFEAALRNLAPLLANSEKRKYPEIFGTPVARKERKIVTWREKNGLL